ALLAQRAAAHARAHDHVALLRLVAQRAGAVEARGALDARRDALAAPLVEARLADLDVLGVAVRLPRVRDVAVERLGHLGSPSWGFGAGALQLPQSAIRSR